MILESRNSAVQFEFPATHTTESNVDMEYSENFRESKEGAPPRSLRSLSVTLEHPKRTHIWNMSSSNIDTLPMEMIERIGDHLSYEDRVNLANTHPKFRFMMPWEQIVEVDPTTLNNVGTETYYMDVPVQSSGLIDVKMSFRRCNPRWIRIRIQLIRDGSVIGSIERLDRCNYSASGWPNHYCSWQLDLSNDVVREARKGDILRLTVLEEFRCGHPVFPTGMRDFIVRIRHKYEI